MKRIISSAIAEERAKGDSAPEPGASKNAKDGVYLIYLVQAYAGCTTANVTQLETATPKPPDVTLQSILKRAATSVPK